MKATELRIGNLSERTNKQTKEKLLIELIASDILDIHASGERSSFIYEPIPLTEEWLLKLGFKYYSLPSENNVKRGYYTMKYGSTFKIIISNKKYYFLNFRKEIEYAHQLQNLYFALTGEELTIKL